MNTPREGLPELLRVSVGDGKYEVWQEPDGRLLATRNGQPWRDITGDGLILALVQALSQPAQVGGEAETFRDAVFDGWAIYTELSGQDKRLTWPQVSDVLDAVAKVARRRLAALPHPQPARGEAVAWARNSGDENDDAFVISAKVKRLWMASNPKRVERYTRPLYTTHVPCWALPAVESALSMLDLQGYWHSDLAAFRDWLKEKSG